MSDKTAGQAIAATIQGKFLIGLHFSLDQSLTIKIADIKREREREDGEICRASSSSRTS